jgi:hypothetical protein
MDHDVYFKKNLKEGALKIVNRHGWISEFIDSENNNVLQLKITGVIGSEESNTSYQIVTSLILLRCKFQDGYLVQNFETWADRSLNETVNPTIIRGVNVFTYFGYRFANTKDNIRKLPKRVLLITCPADIEDLFKKHNHVSQMYKAEQLFFALGQ